MHISKLIGATVTGLRINDDENRLIIETTVGEFVLRAASSGGEDSDDAYIFLNGRNHIEKWRTVDEGWVD